MDNLSANTPSGVIADLPESSPIQGSKSLLRPVAVESKLTRLEKCSSAAAEMPSRTSDFKITKQDDIKPFECINFKNTCFGKLAPLADRIRLLKTISEFSDDDIRLIIKLGRFQDNNEHYFNQLKRFELPDEHHTKGHEEKLNKFIAMRSDNNPELFFMIKDVFLAEAFGCSSRLEDEFGLYFTPSSVWLNPVAEKLRSLNCKRGIEVMAGKGYLSYFLEKYGFNMVASDDHSNYQHPRAASPPIVVRNENSVGTVEEHRESADFLVISWPPRRDGISAIGGYLLQNCLDDYQILKAWGTTKPILFIGERASRTNSPTGSEVFHQHLQLYFNACKFPEYHGRHIHSSDEAIIFIPNGTEMRTAGSLGQALAEACKQQ